jgi:NADH dehydrogenase
MKKSDVVIIGGGPAGRVIGHVLHARNSGLSVTLIKDEEINVNRCAVPYGITGAKPIEKFQIPNTLVTSFGVELVIDRVEKIDPDQKQVQTRKGEIYSYQHLVLATGARPLIPPIPGVDLDGITAVRSLQDLELLRSCAAEGQKAVIVGGGYIGVEVAVVLRQMGLEVTLVEMLPRILLATTEPEFIDQAEDTLTDRGITLLTGRRVVEFEKKDGGALTVKLDDGQSLPTDFAILSIGVVPNIELASDSGIKTTRLGICTDDYQKTSADGVFAAGDCAEKKSFITHAPTRGEFGTNAVFMARVVAQNILGLNKTFPGVINANATTVFDWGLCSAGMTEKMAQDAGIETVTGFSKVMDKYPMMNGVALIRTKLVFDRHTGNLVGGSVMRAGCGAAQSADFLSFAIQMGATWEDLMAYQYATHPELAAKPSDNSYVFAAQDAVKKLKAADTATRKETGHAAHVSSV